MKILTVYSIKLSKNKFGYMKTNNEGEGNEEYLNGKYREGQVK